MGVCPYVPVCVYACACGCMSVRASVWVCAFHVRLWVYRMYVCFPYVWCVCARVYAGALITIIIFFYNCQFSIFYYYHPSIIYNDSIIIIIIIIIPARSAGFYNCTCKKKVFRKYRNPKRKNTNHKRIPCDPTRPGPATRGHACQGIDFVAFFCDIFGVTIIPVRSILTFNQLSRGYFRCAFFAMFRVSAHRVTCYYYHYLIISIIIIIITRISFVYVRLFFLTFLFFSCFRHYFDERLFQ